MSKSSKKPTYSLSKFGLFLRAVMGLLIMFPAYFWALATEALGGEINGFHVAGYIASVLIMVGYAAWMASTHSLKKQ